MKAFIEKTFILFAVLILIVTIYFFLLPDSEKNLHIMLTGMNRAKFYPTQAKFKPYSGKFMGGYAALASAIEDTIKNFNDEQYIFLSLGTELSGSADAFFTKGEAVVKILNQLKINAMLLSNIDFSYGWKQLKNLKEKANFSFIGTNIRNKADMSVPEWLSDGIILKTNGRLKIGVLGISPINTPNLTPSENIEGLTFEKPTKLLKNKTEYLRKTGADIIILLTQYNRDYLTNEEWADISDSKPDVCIILDQDLEPSIPFTRDGILVYSISSYNQTKELDVLNLKFELHPIKITGVSSKRIPIDLADISPNKEIESSINEATSEFRALRNTVIGNFDKDYAKCYMEECPIGNMITDAIKLETGAQIVLQNSGGIQNSIDGGEFTIGNLYSILPFSNKIKIIKLKGKDLLEALNVAASRQRGVLQVSGLNYTFQYNNPSDYTLLSAKLEDNTQIEPDKEYLTAINNFLYEGGDNFTSFTNGKLISEGRNLREIVSDYIKSQSSNGPIKLETYKRIIIEE